MGPGGCRAELLGVLKTEAWGVGGHDRAPRGTGFPAEAAGPMKSPVLQPLPMASQAERRSGQGQPQSCGGAGSSYSAKGNEKPWKGLGTKRGYSAMLSFS